MNRCEVPLSERRGGLGLRQPSLFEPAAKISSIFHKSQLMTRYFPFHYNFNINLHSDNNGNGNNNNQVNSHKNLTTNMITQLDNMDLQFKQQSRFDKKISKHLVEISLKYNHLMAYGKMDLLISQNVIFSKCIASYFDRVDQIKMEFTNVTENTVQYDPTQHTTHRDLINLMDHYFLTK